MSEKTNLTLFEAIRHVDEAGNEFWSARELANILGYTRWRDFKTAIEKARIACENSGQKLTITDHYFATSKMIKAGKGAAREVEDFNLSRYFCYVVIQNADPSKEIVAQCQTYFALRTRQQEEVDKLDDLTAAQRQIYLKSRLSDQNNQLPYSSGDAGVVSVFDVATSQDDGYAGLYAGETASDSHRRKSLKPDLKILDHMGAVELAAKMFQFTQAEAKILRENVKGKDAAIKIHNDVGKIVQATIESLGGSVPENLPAPKETIQEVRANGKKPIKGGPQISRFDEDED